MSPPATGFTALLAALGAPAGPVLVQTHDFPDHDAVAAAFGLTRLLQRCGYAARIVHRGRVNSHSLRSMVDELGISLDCVSGGLPPELAAAPIILVDGSPNNANAKPLGDKLLGVVDHHPNPGVLACPFSDIRVSYGACATLIDEYWREAGLEPERATATALLMGIQMDTDFLARQVSPADLDAFRRLFFSADWQFGTRVVKAALSLTDLAAFASAIARSRTRGKLFYTDVPQGCSQEFISILADFFLRLREISVTAIVESGGAQRHVSVRSRSPDLSAAAIIRHALSGIGEGGGHDHMAGGVIDAARCPSGDALLARFISAVETAQENQ